MIDAADKEQGGKRTSHPRHCGSPPQHLAGHLGLDEPTPIYPLPTPVLATSWPETQRLAKPTGKLCNAHVRMEIQLDDEEMLMNITTNQLL